MRQRTIVVLGGAVAGLAAAARAREQDENARILLVEKGRRVGHASCGLAYHASGEVEDLADLDRERTVLFESIHGIEVATEAEAVEIAPAVRRVELRHSDDRIEEIEYDALVYALGASSSSSLVPGLEGDNVCQFRTQADLDLLVAARERGATRVAILGGGPLGVEAADGLLRAGLEVTLLERSGKLLPRFGPEASTMAREALLAMPGASVLLGVTADRAEQADGRVRSLILSNGREIETDLVIEAVGLKPHTDLLARAGARLADDDTLVIDSRAQTSLPGVFACGMCVSVTQFVNEAPVWWPQASIADKLAQVAGANAAGGDAHLVPAVGAKVIRAGEVSIGRAGLTHDEARALLPQANLHETVVHAPAREPFFPGSTPLTVSLLWDRQDGRLLGVEVGGASGVDKRVDVSACALAGGMTIDALAGLDLAYAPPYSAARDPLNVAGSVAVAEFSGLAVGVLPESAHARRQRYLMLDVRAGGSAGGQTIEGSLHLPLEILRERLSEIDPTAQVIAWDDDGRRGYLGARILRQRGWSDAAFLAGGLVSWRLRGLPVTDR